LRLLYLYRHGEITVAGAYQEALSRRHPLPISGLDIHTWLRYDHRTTTTLHHP
jgi:hypothetical protein